MGHCLDKAAEMACFRLNLGGESDYCYAIAVTNSAPKISFILETTNTKLHSLERGTTTTTVFQ